jgi:hypothetical protein
MNMLSVTDPKIPIGEILEDMGSEGILLEGKNQRCYAVIPLDDDLLDYLVERSPKFIEDCRQIREQMRAGKFHSRDEVRQLFQDDST